MIKQTTVNGYHLQRLNPKLGELERWAVDKNRLHYGHIVKAVYKGHFGEAPVVFWFCSIRKYIGWRKFTVNKVANIRREIIKELAKIIEGK